jgi:hypothetical protein
MVEKKNSIIPEENDIFDEDMLDIDLDELVGKEDFEDNKEKKTAKTKK